ncbi:MAG: choice-of-anchor D domain-containing protein [Pseudomonadota bacterium]|nr:choice-of-anchor D domain-containing protein [Pseudomonadota bacterium]
MTRAALCAALLPLLAACVQDQEFGKRDDVAGAEGAEIEVAPQRLDFGSLAAGEAITKTFTVSNVGVEESILEVSEITIGGAAGGFTILTPLEELAFSLPGGASTEIEVAFTPEGANEQVAEAIVASDDEDERRVTVDLLGEGRVPELEISPDPLDLGTAYVGCDKDHDITLTNVGTDDLIVTAITHTGGAFVLTDLNVLPLTLAPEASTLVNISFTPLVEGPEVGELAVTSNEPIGTRVSAQTAEGRYAGEYEDTFEVPTNPPADIIFFVDQSCSMDDDAAALASNFAAFISNLSVYTTNWHVMVTNDDDGCSTQSGILTSSTARYESTFNDAVSEVSFFEDFWTEAGLTVTSRAVEETDAGGCNSGFLRASAILHIIMVSDEPEQSSRSWDHYVDTVVAKKGDPALVKFSAVAGDYPSGCTSGANSAEFGSGYYEAVNATGGEYLSICSNWSTSVEALATASVDMFVFELTRTPVPETIAVTLNGATRTGWAYDAAANSIVFDEAARPEEGDVVVVSYAGLASCD